MKLLIWALKLANRITVWMLLKATARHARKIKSRADNHATALAFANIERAKFKEVREHWEGQRE